MASLYFKAEEKLKKEYDVDLLNQIVLARGDRAIYYLEYKEDSILFNKIHGNSPMDLLEDGDSFSFDLIERLFDMNSKYGEVAGKKFYKDKNLGLIKDMVHESNVTIPLSIKGERKWMRFHSYSVKKDESGKTVLASCYITDVSRYLIDEELIYEKTHKDELTHLFNRYALYYHFELRGSKTPLVSFYFDIDDFKLYNDTYGHKYGDTVLKMFSSKLLELSSDTFTCYRLGGDEFYCLLIDANEGDHIKYTELIRESISNSTVEEIGHKLSVSIGVVCTKDDITNKYEAFMKQADKMMYESKDKGKNSVSYSDFEVFKK
jgi:diguanylate cyclase (GGDEF)-like protein